MKDILNIENQYQLYLRRVNITEDEMGEVQRREMRKTFYGAVGQILVLLREDLSSMSEMEAVHALEKMDHEVCEFWRKELQRHIEQSQQN